MVVKNFAFIVLAWVVAAQAAAEHLDDARHPMGRGTIRRQGRVEGILFGRMYEDAAIEQAAFPPGGHVFCIASAGCTAMALAPRHRDCGRHQPGAARICRAPRRRRADARRRGGAYGRHRPAAHGAIRLAAPQPRGVPRARRSRGTDRRFGIAAWTRSAFAWPPTFCSGRAWLRLVYAAPFLQILPPRFGRGDARAAGALLEDPSQPHQRVCPGLAPRGVTSGLPARSASDSVGMYGRCLVSRIVPTGKLRCVHSLEHSDGAPDSYRDRLMTAVRRSRLAESLVILRSFAEPRSDSSTNLAARDRSMLWGVVDVRRVHSL